MEGRAIVFSNSYRVELLRFPVRALRAGEVLLKTAFSCVSPGTELRRLSGKESLGRVDFPFIPGYSLAGRVMAAGLGTGFAEGQLAVTHGTLDADKFGLSEGGHVSHVIASPDTLVPVPQGVDLLDASAAILAGIAYHGLAQSRPLAGEKVAVVGLGIIGQLAARLHATSGAHVVGCDLSESRVRLAESGGIEAFVPKGNMKEGFQRFFPHGADILIDATGVPAVFTQAMQLVRANPWNPVYDTPGSRCLIQGSYEEAFSVPYLAAYSGQASILFPRGSQVADWRRALELLAQKRLKIRDLIAVRAPEEAARTYPELQAGSGKSATVAFQWE